MAEVLVAYTVPVKRAGVLYWPKALTRLAPDGLWEGWLEFTRDDSEVIRTSRETAQPRRDEVLYWATGLSTAYLEGAVERALRPKPVRPLPAPRTFVDSAPRPRLRNAVLAPARVVLDPFQACTEGEELLRKQLRALSHGHLQNIVEAYQLDNDHPRDWARTAPDDALVAVIVAGVRERLKGWASGRGRVRAAGADRRSARGPHPRG